jgi:hypothetical protein
VRSDAKLRRALRATGAGDISQGGSVRYMEPFKLEPRYSTNEIPGKCIKCLGEQELNNCLMQMLRGEDVDEDVQQKYEALVAFLQSPESRQLRVESERYLSEGKRVSIVIKSKNGKPEYELKID